VSVKKMAVASAMLYTVMAIFIISGLIYSFTPRIMPYHEHFLGKTHEELEPRTAELILKALRVIGGSFIALGISYGMLIKKYFARGDNWIRWLLFITGITAYIPIFIVTLNVGIWPAVLIPPGLVLSAFVLSSPGRAGA
jgi:hypothetical protein